MFTKKNLSYLKYTKINRSHPCPPCSSQSSSCDGINNDIKPFKQFIQALLEGRISEKVIQNSMKIEKWDENRSETKFRSDPNFMYENLMKTERALQIFELNNIHQCGKESMLKDNYEQAMIYFIQSYEIGYQIEAIDEMCEVLYSIYELYKELNSLEDAKLTLQFLLTIMKNNKYARNVFKDRRKIYKDLSEIYVTLKNNDRAKEYQERYQRVLRRIIKSNICGKWLTLPPEGIPGIDEWWKENIERMFLAWKKKEINKLPGSEPNKQFFYVYLLTLVRGDSVNEGYYLLQSARITLFDNYPRLCYEYLQMGKEIFERFNDYVGLAGTYDLLSKIVARKGKDLPLAWKYAKKGLEVAKKSKDPYAIAFAEQNLSDLLFKFER